MATAENKESILMTYEDLPADDFSTAVAADDDDNDFIRSIRKVALSSNTFQVSIPHSVIKQLGLIKGSRIKFGIATVKKYDRSRNKTKEVTTATIVKYD